MNSTQLFSLDLEGSRVLVPDFILGLRRVLPRLEKGFVTHFPAEDLRRAALSILGSIFALPNHFDGVTISNKWEELENVYLINGNIMAEELPVINKIRALYVAPEDLVVEPTPGSSVEEATAITEEIVQPVSLSGAPQHSRLTALKPSIIEMLVLTLVAETQSGNVKFVLYLLCSMVFEEVRFCTKLPGIVIGIIKEKVWMFRNLMLPES
jgi:hypothetical protein